MGGFSHIALAQETIAETVDTPISAQLINPADVVGWEICNETSYILRLAHATLRDAEIKAQGWREVNPSQCVIELVIRNAPRFLYAESSPIHRGGIREWKGDIQLCANDTEFSAAITDNCRMSNLGTRDYFAVDPNEAVTRLIEPSDFGENAYTAGLQRLLRDAGYKITAIDGRPGRRTSRSLREFQKAEDIDTLPEGDLLIEALAASAKALGAEIGLEVCNKSDGRIFTAIGMQENGNWISKGWWAVTPNTCSRLITQSLIGMDAHYYAIKEPPLESSEEAINIDLPLLSRATVPSQFCIAESQFSALGRELCIEKGYSVANFAPLPTDQDGVTLSLTNGNFATQSETGLRQ